MPARYNSHGSTWCDRCGVTPQAWRLDLELRDVQMDRCRICCFFCTQHFLQSKPSMDGNILPRANPYYCFSITLPQDSFLQCRNRQRRNLHQWEQSHDDLRGSGALLPAHIHLFSARHPYDANARHADVFWYSHWHLHRLPYILLLDADRQLPNRYQ